MIGELLETRFVKDMNGENIADVLTLLKGNSIHFDARGTIVDVLKVGDEDKIPYLDIQVHCENHPQHVSQKLRYYPGDVYGIIGACGDLINEYRRSHPLH